MTAFAVDEHECVVRRKAAELCRADERSAVRNRLATYVIRRNQRLQDIHGIRVRNRLDLVRVERINRNSRVNSRTRTTTHTCCDDFFNLIVVSSLRLHRTGESRQAKGQSGDR